MVNVLPDRDPVTLDGFGGSVPSSYCCMSLLISSCRHFHWAFEVTAAPFANWNGLGRPVTVAPRLRTTAGHEVLPLLGEAVGADEMTVVGGMAVDVCNVVGAAELESACAPGWHCEYQSFTYLQLLPDAHDFDPVYPLPPHCPQTAT